MNVATSIVTLTLLAILAPLGEAQLHDESVNGDLSDSAAAPTSLSLAAGSNLILGTVVNGADQRDFLSFSVPASHRLVALHLLAYDDVGSGGAGFTGYHAINSGATSFNPSLGTAGSFLGGDHVLSFMAGSDVLPNLAAAGTNGTGFSLPLGPGTYSYVIQQTGAELTSYSLDFVLEAVWTDQGFALAGAGGLPALSGSGQLSAGSLNTVALTNAAPSAQSGLFVAFGDTPTPFKGGTLTPVPWVLFKLLNTNPSGNISIPFSMPAGLPSGTELWIQYAIQDAGAPVNVALSNAIRGVTP